mgnify:CR=1 FL=1
MSKAAELAALIGSQTALSNRNLIINGAMQVAQRGTSTTGVTTNTYLIDRFSARTSAGSINLSQTTTAPAGFTNSFKVEVNTTDAFSASNSEVWLNQNVEAQNLQHLQYGLSTAQKITLSFWVRSNTTGTYGVWFYQEDSGKDYSTSYTINSANTWEKKSVVITGNTADIINNDNGVGFYVRWYLDGGSDRRGSVTESWNTTSSTSTKVPTGAPAWMNGSNDWYLTGVQLELGEQATPFEHRSYGEELARCERYFETGRSKLYCSVAMTGMTLYVPHRTTKRANPTVTVISGSHSPTTIEQASVEGIKAYRNTGNEISYEYTADAEL